MKHAAYDKRLLLTRHDDDDCGDGAVGEVVSKPPEAERCLSVVGKELCKKCEMVEIKFQIQSEIDPKDPFTR